MKSEVCLIQLISSLWTDFFAGGGRGQCFDCFARDGSSFLTEVESKQSPVDKTLNHVSPMLVKVCKIPE